MKIAVYQGERDLISENRKLAEFDLKGIPSMPAGFPKVDINFLLNADGILTIQAIELRSGVKQEVEVKPTYGITDDQVEQMLLDSITHAKEDVAQRMLIEARTEGEQMVYTVERFLQKPFYRINHLLTFSAGLDHHALAYIIFGVGNAVQQHLLNLVVGYAIGWFHLHLLLYPRPEFNSLYLQNAIGIQQKVNIHFREASRHRRYSL